MLLATKVNVPQITGRLVARPRLTDALHQGIARPLVIVSTPAGFGKSTLLATWARGTGRPVAWISLDQDDNDPARFWRYVAAAVGRVYPDVGARLTTLLTGPAPARLETVPTELINELAAQPEELVLVLDDYQAIVSESVQEALGFLVTHLPAQLHMVIASRVDPALPLARLRARGQVAELNAGDLRFTSQEASAFLRDLWGLELTADTVAALETRTEGWAAGLQLAALSLRGQVEPAAFVRVFSGTHRFILDYLSEEVLERQTERVRTFLVETSILDRLSAPLCDATTGRSGSRELIATVEQANLFLIALDEERLWYRYHHLFADLLRARLRQQGPARERELHRNAAAWCEAHGLIDAAVRHAVRAREVPWAAELVERHVEEIVLRWGERETMDRWLASLPREVVRARARLSLIQAVSAGSAGRLAETERALDAVEAAAWDPDERHEPSIGRAASTMTNVPAATAILRAEVALLRGDPHAERAFAAQAQARLQPEDGVLRILFEYHRSMADWLEGHLAEAEQGLARIASGGRAEGEIIVPWAAYFLGQVQRAGGRLGAAVRTHRQTLDSLTAPGEPYSPAAGMALVGMAEVELQRGQVDDAVRHLTEGVRLCRHLPFWEPLVAGLAALAWTRQIAGDPAGAMAVLAEAEQAIANQEVVAFMNPVIMMRARLLLAQGDLDGAERWMEERGVGEEDPLTYAREPEFMMLARVLLAQDASERAPRLLQAIAEAAEADGRIASLIEARVLRALAFQATGDHDRAMAALAAALSLGWPEGYVRVFTDEGPPVAAMLRRLLTRRRRHDPPADRAVPVEYIGRILRTFEPAEPSVGDRTGPVAGLVDQLTDRELEVLRLVAAGRRNQEIANELVVSLDTVKKHVTHIYSKLGATSRTQALAQARALGLIT